MNQLQSIIVSGRLVRLGRLESDSFDPPSNAEELIAGLRDSSPVDVLTLVQTMPHVKPTWPYYMEWDNVAALPVTTFENWWTRQVDRKTRNIVRKSEKEGIVVRRVPYGDSTVASIHRIYNESPVRHGKRFWHYGKTVETVRLENASFADRSVFLSAEWQGEAVGFAKLVVSSDGHQARLMQILSMVAHRDKSPTNALIAEAVRVCEERGIGHLCYGSFSYGKKQRDSLTDFKSNNGFERVEVPRYYIPISLRGRVGLELGLHRRLADRVPELMIARFREARRRWYARSANA